MRLRLPVGPIYWTRLTPSRWLHFLVADCSHVHNSLVEAPRLLALNMRQKFGEMQSVKI